MNFDLTIINAILFDLKDKKGHKWYIALINNLFDAHL